MSDLLSAMLGNAQSAAGDTKSTQSQSDLLVASYKQSQQPKVDALTTKQKDLETRQTFFNNLNSKINALLSNIDTFTLSNAESKFATRSITSSDANVATASADGTAITGVNIMKVNRLATNDILIGKSLNRTELFGLTGKHTIAIKALDKDVAPVEVDFGDDPALTNEAALKKIANAINARTDLGMTSSYLQDSTTTGRLTFTSKETGSDYKVTFAGGADNQLLSKLGLNDINDRVGPSGSGDAHYKTADSSLLSSEIIMNGVKVTRNENSLKDVLSGVTINLLKPSETDVVLKTDINSSAVESLIAPILNSYNDILTFLTQNKTIKKNESSIGSLLSDLRSIPSQKMNSSSSSSDPAYLTDIGIKIGTDGKLSVGDKSKLETWLKAENGSQKVAALFINKKDPADPTKAVGFATKLNESIKAFVGYTDEKGNSIDGIIKSRKSSLDKQIVQVKDRTKTLEDRIDKQANTMRKEYESMLKVYLEAQSQGTMLNTLNSY